jgi:hypothetical protein
VAAFDFECMGQRRGGLGRRAETESELEAGIQTACICSFSVPFKPFMLLLFFISRCISSVKVIDSFIPAGA